MLRAKILDHSALVAAVIAASLSWSASAAASQTYYDQIVMQTSTCADCRLCHQGPVGSLATLDLANKPFAANWFTSGKPLPLPMNNVDSDMDGVSDLAELTGDGMGGGMGDPNDPMIGLGQFECPTGPEPEYGCARIAPAPATHDRWALLLSLVPALLLLRRRS